MDIKRQNGFTLYELMITLMIVGVVITIGVPNLTEFTQNSRLSGASNDLLSSFQLARSEAARSKSNITICASDNSLAPDAQCGGTFNDGWIIFVDLDGNLVRGAGENVLRSHPAPPAGVTILPDNGGTYFAFAATGLGRGDVGGAPSLQTAMICDGRGVDDAPGGRATARRLVATAIGRASIISDKGQILAAGGACP